MSKWKASRYADVIPRRMRCGSFGCRSDATLDVSLRRWWGDAMDWQSLCRAHARALVERHEREEAAREADTRRAREEG